MIQNIFSNRQRMKARLSCASFIHHHPLSSATIVNITDDRMSQRLSLAMPTRVIQNMAVVFSLLLQLAVCSRLPSFSEFIESINKPNDLEIPFRGYGPVGLINLAPIHPPPHDIIEVSENDDEPTQTSSVVTAPVPADDHCQATSSCADASIICTKDDFDIDLNEGIVDAMMVDAQDDQHIPINNPIVMGDLNGNTQAPPVDAIIVDRLPEDRIRFRESSTSAPEFTHNPFIVNMKCEDYETIMSMPEQSKSSLIPLKTILACAERVGSVYRVKIVPDGTHLTFKANTKLLNPQLKEFSNFDFCSSLKKAKELIERLNFLMIKLRSSPDDPVFQIPMVKVGASCHHCFLNAGYLAAFFQRILHKRSFDQHDIPQWSVSPKEGECAHFRFLALKIAGLLTNYQGELKIVRNGSLAIAQHVYKCLDRQIKDLTNALDQDAYNETKDNSCTTKQLQGSTTEQANEEKYSVSISLNQDGVKRHLRDWDSNVIFWPLKAEKIVKIVLNGDSGLVEFNLEEMFDFTPIVNSKFNVSTKLPDFKKDKHKLLEPLQLANDIIKKQMEIHHKPYAPIPLETRPFSCILNAAYVVHLFNSISATPTQSWDKVELPTWNSKTQKHRNHDYHRLLLALRFAAMMTGYAGQVGNLKDIYKHLCATLNDLVHKHQ